MGSTNNSGISQEHLKEARDLIGVELNTNDRGLRRRHHWNTKATIDNIRQFVEGYGDNNPLFISEDYARDTPWGGVIAPPTWLYTIDSAIVAPKLPGLQWINGGTRFEYEDRPVRVGDEFNVTAKLKDVKVKNGETAGEMVLQEGEVEYYNRDELIATATNWILRTQRPETSEEDPTIKQERDIYWTEDEIKEIEEQILQYERAGSNTRYWDTVSVGDELEPRIKGPLSVTDVICWYMGCGGPTHYPHEHFVRERQKHPDEVFRREDIGIYEHPAAGHVDRHVAKGIGSPDVYDIGLQRVTWLSHPVTDWVSDAGFVKSFEGRLKRMNYLGDVTWCEAEVENKYIDEETGEHLVDIKLKGVNQEGITNSTGEAIVRLPHSSE